MIPLVCGNPAEKPASYTRFVLPFAYALEHSPKKFFCHNYQPEPLIESQKVWRKNYLTVETSLVLFQRAKWFRLPDEVSIPAFYINRLDREISVQLGRPQLVLFEQSQAGFSQNGKEQEDLLQTGFLIVEAYFPTQGEQPNLDDLLEFNEKFRYWQRPYEGHEKDYCSLLANCPIDLRTQNTTIGESTPSETYFERWAPLLDIPLEDGHGGRWRLFPQTWTQQAKDWVAGSGWQSGWIVHADNRTFVWTCALVEGGGKGLQEGFSEKPWQPLKASDFGHWIKLLNVDAVGSASQKSVHNSTAFERDWASVRTYHRWEESGTFYGFTYHSGALLAPPHEEPPLWRHFGQMYFDQTLLLLYLRVGSFRFSRELSRISADARDATHKGPERWQKAFQDLRWSFALFTNLYEFPLLSSQQQGIELYELARESLDVEQLFREIQQEIQSSHDYLQIQVGQEQTQVSVLLTIVATLGLSVGLAIGFFGMDIASPGLTDYVTAKFSPYIGKAASEWGLFSLTAIFCLVCICWLASISKRIVRFFLELANRDKKEKASR